MNTLYQGDNLTILRALPDASVDLIATDPPFNTGRHWGAFNDKWEGGLKGYLKFMEPRLIECRRVLKDTGSLYLHCDPTASHYLKIMLDGVFGIKQFRNDIIWKRSHNKSGKKRFGRNHDNILFYTKSDNFIFSNPSQLNSLWLDIPIASPKQRVGYPTQKPLALYERMIKIASNQGGVVLDLFAGSGTTLDAAHTLGRGWIGIDNGTEAIKTIQDRLRQRHGLEYNRDYELHI